MTGVALLVKDCHYCEENDSLLTHVFFMCSSVLTWQMALYVCTK